MLGHWEVTAPMTGVVTRIYPIQGEAVRPGQPLFEVRLTHEDLLQLQAEFLRTVEELDVIGGRGVAVAVNDEVRPRSAWPTSELHDGDEVIVLTATQGG